MKKPLIRLNKDIFDEHIETLKVANEAWFYGYHFSKYDQKALDRAIEFINHINKELRGKQNDKTI